MEAIDVQRKPTRRDARTDVWAEILRRHESGERHTRIAEDLGISRERVRQIVARVGGKPRSIQREEDWRNVLSIAERAGASADEVASALRVTVQRITQKAQNLKVGLKPRSRRKHQLAKRAAGHVLMGASYIKAAAKVGLSSETVRRYCIECGIISTHRSGNPNFRRAQP